MFETFSQLIHRQPGVTIFSVVVCAGIAVVVSVVWKEIFNFEFWDE